MDRLLRSVGVQEGIPFSLNHQKLTDLDQLHLQRILVMFVWESSKSDWNRNWDVFYLKYWLSDQIKGSSWKIDLLCHGYQLVIFISMLMVWTVNLKLMYFDSLFIHLNRNTCSIVQSELQTWMYTSDMRMRETSVRSRWLRAWCWFWRQFRNFRYWEIDLRSFHRTLCTLKKQKQSISMELRSKC